MQVLTQSIVSVVFPRINLQKIWVASFILITSLIIFYIFQISEIASSTFHISSYEQSIAQLSQNNKDLEIKLSQLNYLTNLESILQNFNYEKVGKVYYIRIIDGQMAAKP
ncbi:MAG: hypothetical protein HYV47_03485 [Candidatus Nealsonbacteria bacterium]|nr:hypothetical protein [Candidatus Nealsonbacteria bacterium]